MLKNKNSHTSRYLLGLISISIIIRIVIYIFVEPQITADSHSYFKLAEFIKEINLSNYCGLRAPGYPFLIILASFNNNIIMLFQLILGLLISVNLFVIIYKLTQNNIFAFISGILYIICYPFLIWETAILTETLSVFFISSIFLLLLKVFEEPNKIIFSLLLGLCASLLALTKPQFIIIIFILFFFLLIYLEIQKILIKKIIRSLLCFILPVIILLGGWCLINLHYHDTFSLSTATGLHLSQQIRNFIGDAPDKYDYYKKMYIEQRKKEILGKGDHYNTIWHIEKEMRERDSLSFAQLSKIFQQMFIETVMLQPNKYLKNVFHSWIFFWDQDIWSDFEFIPHFFYEYFEKYLFFLIQFIFFLFPILYFFQKKKIDLSIMDKFFFLILYISAISSSVIHALIESPSPRLSVPTDILIIVAAIYALYTEIKIKIFIKIVD